MADAAGVGDADAVDGAVELHVRMPADDDALIDAREQRAQPIVWRQPSDRQLTVGVSGEDVKELEDNLISLGYGDA